MFSSKTLKSAKKKIVFWFLSGSLNFLNHMTFIWPTMLLDSPHLLNCWFSDKAHLAGFHTGHDCCGPNPSGIVPGAPPQRFQTHLIPSNPRSSFIIINTHVEHNANHNFLKLLLFWWYYVLFCVPQRSSATHGKLWKLWKRTHYRPSSAKTHMQVTLLPEHVRTQGRVAFTFTGFEAQL